MTDREFIDVRSSNLSSTPNLLSERKSFGHVFNKQPPLNIMNDIHIEKLSLKPNMSQSYTIETDRETKTRELVDYSFNPQSQSQFFPKLARNPAPFQFENEEVKKQEPKKVKMNSVAQMVNDLTHLMKLKNIAKPNVEFKINQKSLSVHSTVLLARSAWFRRSWRMNNDKFPESNRDFSKYNFGFINNDETYPDISIELRSGLPTLPNGEFKFEIHLLNKQDEKEFLEALKQFREFLYKGTCAINEVNSKHLLVIAEAFQIQEMKESLSSYYMKSVNINNINALLSTLELTHVYKLQELKEICIKMINQYPALFVNAASWKTLSKKYPNLILEIFCKR